MPTIYPSLAMGAVRRLAIFRNEASGKQWVRPMTWRDVRFSTLKSHTGLDKGLNDNKPIWYCHDGEQFRNERDADDILSGMHHSGWYTDSDDTGELAIGIVAGLPHGRFIAGYRLTMNDERVYFPEIFSDESDAAKMADEHARVIAEQERDYSYKAREATELQESIEESEQRLIECIALRNKPRMAYVRGEVSTLIRKIRRNRGKLQSEFKDFI